MEGSPENVPARSAEEKLREIERLVNSEGEVGDALAEAKRSGEPVAVQVTQGGESLGATYQLAWHGSPHRGIEKEGFKTEKIGTGEGTQIEGWGIYFSDNKEVSERYRRALSLERAYYKDKAIEAYDYDDLNNLRRTGTRAERKIFGEAFRDLESYPISTSVEISLSSFKIPADVINEVGQYIRRGGVEPLSEAASIHFSGRNNNPDLKEARRWLRRSLKNISLSKDIEDSFELRRVGDGVGQLYRVQIPESEELLDWDKPFKEQPQKVKAALIRISKDIGGLKFVEKKGVFDFLKRFLPRQEESVHDSERGINDGQRIYRELASAGGNGDIHASKLLQSYGIPGLRYSDGKNIDTGEPRYNFVIWDEARLTPEVAKIGTTYQLRAFNARRYEEAAAKGETKLSQGQWQQVHTPEFKAWFGDWQKLRAQKRVDAMEPVELQLDEKLKGASVPELRKAVVKHLADLAKAGVKANNPEVGEVGFANSKTGKIVSTSAAPEKLHTTLDIVRVIEAAHLVGSEDSYKGEHAEHGVLYHTLATKVSAFGREFVAITTIEQATTGTLFYNNIAVESGQKNAPVAYPRNSESGDSAITSAFTGAGQTKLGLLRRVNPESVSRAVDPATGEPLVVYHGTGEQFTVFNTRSTPNYTFSGLFFSEQQETAEGYAWGADGDTMPVWLRMQRPLFVNAADSHWSELGGDISISGHRKFYTLGEAFGLEEDADSGYDPFATFTTDEVARWARDEGFDGVVFTDVLDETSDSDETSPTSVYAVFDSEQVKSAIGNRGTFDGSNPDITYQLGERSGREVAKRQAFEATGVPQSILDEIEARLSRVRARKVQERDAALRLSPAAQAAGAAADEVGLATRVARGALDRWAEPVRRRLEKINPVLGAQLARLEFTANRQRARGLDRSKGFLDGVRELAYRMGQYRGVRESGAAQVEALAAARGALAGAEVSSQEKTSSEQELLAALGRVSGDDYVELDLALKNRDAARRDRVLAVYGLTEAWGQVEQLLADYNARLRAAGFEFGWLEHYFPRRVTDLSGLLGYLESNEAATLTALDEAIAAVIKSRGQGQDGTAATSPIPTDAAQRDEIARGILEGRIRLPDNLRKRVIVQVTEGMNRFYASPAEALSHYIEQVSEALAAAELFKGYAQYEAAKGGQEGRAREGQAQNLQEKSEVFSEDKTTSEGDGSSTDEGLRSANELPLDDIGDLFGLQLGPSITAYVRGLVESGAVRGGDAAQVEQMLRARFNRTKAGWRVLRPVKNVTLLTTLGHVTTALTQIGDLAFSLYESGFYNTVSAIAKVAGSKKRAVAKGAVTKELLGIDQIAEGFKDGSTLGKAVDWVFRKTGFEHMDRVGKEAIMTAKLRQLGQEARRGELNPKAQAMLAASFAPQAHGQILEDLAKGRHTEDTLFLAYSTLANFQPISLSEYPQAYLNHPNGRLFYLLKTFTLKSISAMRREGISKIVHGKTAAEKAAGFRNLLWLAGLMYLIGVPTDGLKDLIMGRGVRLDDLHVDNMLKLVGVNRWITWRFRDGHVFQSAKAVAGPPMPWWDYPKSDWEKIQKQQAKGLDADLSLLETWKLVPIVGRPWYWHFGGGHEKLRRQEERRQERLRRGGR